MSRGALSIVNNEIYMTYRYGEFENLFHSVSIFDMTQYSKCSNLLLTQLACLVYLYNIPQHTVPYTAAT